MKTTTTLFFLLMGAGAAAQCTSAVPSSAVVITNASAANITGSSQNYWVCSDAFQKIFTGSNNNIWIESGAFVAINGNTNTVRYKGTLPLGVFGGSNTIYAQTAGAVSDQGSGNTVTACGAGAVVFTYGSAPAGGCAVVGIAEQDVPELAVYPNPVHDLLVVKAGQAIVEQVRIYDVEGRVVVTHVGNNTANIPVGQFAQGTYVISIVTDQGTAVRRFVKM